MQVLNMFEKAEAEYQTLAEKKRIVNNDKSKIQQVGRCFCTQQRGRQHPESPNPGAVKEWVF